MKKKYAAVLLIILFVPLIILTVSLLKGKKENPVTLTLWHNYGGQMKETMDEMIEEFNSKIGTKEGVIINVTSISGSSTLHDKLTAAANKDPGAPRLPDITTAYPKTALILSENNLLVNLKEQFTAKELSGYIPRFIEEGQLNTDKLYVFPTAKSTEVMFVNSTIFNRFSKAAGITLTDLSTFEGIARASSLYYEWTDKQTPDIPGDGKAFYVPDSIFNLSMIGCEQLGYDFIKANSIDFSTPAAKKVWKNYFTSAVCGSYAIFDGYASDLAKTGEIVCSTGSTAGVLFFSTKVTYADNTTEDAKLTILPYPTFDGGRKIALQRGAGMCVIKSNKKKERLAGIFLKWFTSPANNLRFVASTGYLPVTEEAYGDIMQNEIKNVSDHNIKNLLRVSKQMEAEYDFYIPPLFDGIDDLQSTYEGNIKVLASETKDTYRTLLKSEDSKTAQEKAVNGKFKEFVDKFK